MNFFRCKFPPQAAESDIAVIVVHVRPTEAFVPCGAALQAATIYDKARLGGIGRFLESKLRQGRTDGRSKTSPDEWPGAIEQRKLWKRKIKFLRV